MGVLDFNPFIKRSKKQQKADRLRDNQRKGLESQDGAFMMSSLNPFKEVKKIHRGGDRMERSINILTGRKGKWHIIEHKTGKAKTSDAQNKSKRKFGKRFHIERNELAY